jgi:hypothetical protein
VASMGEGADWRTGRLGSSPRRTYCGWAETQRVAP